MYELVPRPRSSRPGRIHGVVFLPLALLAQASCLESLDTAPPESTEDRAFFHTGRRWNDPRIDVCWRSTGFAAEREWVREAIEDSWEAESSVDFVGWDRCNNTRFTPGINIHIDDERPHTTALGDELDGRYRGMVLNFRFRNWNQGCQSQREFCIRSIAVHEFGHALGFAHEQDRSDTPRWCHERLARPDYSGEDGNIQWGPWDADSVMNYCNGYTDELSDGDIDAVRHFYGTDPVPPPPPPCVSRTCVNR